jgi:hypothetical protein
MGKIISFDEFSKKGAELTEDDLEFSAPDQENAENEANHEGTQYYMFFKNISAIKHYISEIEKMDPDQLDSMLQKGHDWAADHMSTAKDDIQEVAEWVNSEMEGQAKDQQEGPENIIVDVEGSDDEVEVETGEDEKEEEESEDDSEEDTDEEE